MKETPSTELKPRRCPVCGSSWIAKILYGYPGCSPDLQRELDRGEVVLGGCIVFSFSPEWQCMDCYAQIYKGGYVLDRPGENK